MRRVLQGSTVSVSLEAICNHRKYVEHYVSTDFGSSPCTLTLLIALSFPFRLLAFSDSDAI